MLYFLMKTKSSTPRKRRLPAILAYSFAVLLIVSGTLGAFGPSNLPKAYADGNVTTEYSKDQLDALNFLNEIRAKVGVPPVRLNPYVTQAAEAHASYYNRNHAQHPNLSAHSEQAGMPGFKGVNIKNRIEAAGFVAQNRGFAYGEVMHYHQKSSSQAVQGWLDTAYHRKIILDPSYDEVGIGLVDGTAVMDFTGSGSRPSSENMSVYPYDRQTDVPVGFYGLESPNPLRQFNVEFSGYIISASTGVTINRYQAKMTDQQGNEVPLHEELYGSTLFLYPKSVLKGNHTYTVTLELSSGESAEALRKTWSFTTGKGHSLTELGPYMTEVTLNQGEQLQLKWRSFYDDGSWEDAETGISYITSNPKGLTASTNGMIHGILPGEYTLKATLEGKSSQAKIKVYPKWKTKTYSKQINKLPSDIQGHSLQEALEWGLRSGIVSADAQGQLRPDSTVSESEFWIMLLKTYNVDIQSYQKGKESLADTAYRIAKDRNYPLLGLKTASLRDKPINRQRIAEIVSAADGMHFIGSNAVRYVLAKDYVRAVSELSYSGYESESTVTRAEALNILKRLQSSLDTLKGRPAEPTDLLALPKMPERVLYVKPAVFEEQSLFAQYDKGGKLIVEGQFSQLKDRTILFKVQEHTVTGSKHIEDVQVTFDSKGYFHIEPGTYSPDQLNLYLYAPSATFFISVKKDTMNLSQYSTPAVK